MARLAFPSRSLEAPVEFTPLGSSESHGRVLLYGVLAVRHSCRGRCRDDELRDATRIVPRTGTAAAGTRASRRDFSGACPSIALVSQSVRQLRWWRFCFERRRKGGRGRSRQRRGATRTPRRLGDCEGSNTRQQEPSGRQAQSPQPRGHSDAGQKVGADPAATGRV